MIRLRRRVFPRRAAWLVGSVPGLALLSSACGLLPPQSTARMPRIGYLSPGPREAWAESFVDPFLAGLRDLGYVEGQTVSIEWRFTPEGLGAKYLEMAFELVRSPVEVIVVAFATPAAQAARQATSTIPIVAVGANGLLETGLVASLARPGGNVTGLTSAPPGMFAKWVDLLRELVPGLARVAALVDATNPAYDIVGWDDLRTAGDEAGLHVERIDLRSANDVDAALEAAVSIRADAVIDVQNPVLLPVRAHYAALALQHRLPCMSGQREFVQSGHFMAYGPNYPALYRGAASYVDKILNGTRPADLPVQQPNVWDLTVNTTTLQALGLTIPSSVLPLVTEWIQ